MKRPFPLFNTTNEPKRDVLINQNFHSISSLPPLPRHVVVDWR
jgi:hypothetical protein